MWRRNPLLLGAALVCSAFLLAPGCGGRDQLSYGPISDDGFGGGYGGATNVGGTPMATSVGQGGAPQVSSVGMGGSSSVVTVTTVGTGGAPSGVSSVGTTVSSSVVTVTTVGTGGAPSTTGIGGGSVTSTSSGPLDCFSCVNQSCPQAAQCLSTPSCLNGVVCSVSQCLNGGAPNFGCVIDCFNGDFMAAFQALQAMGCVLQQCGQECQGLFGP